MPICDQCGGEIEFRIVDGRVRPIHQSGGWGCTSDSGGGGVSGWSSNPSRPRLHPSYRIGTTYVNPNASCPVCGADVFFYQSPDYVRVFFDELGPPWPKHACTDQGLDHPMIRRALDQFVVGAAQKRKLRALRRNLDPRWATAGFVPFSLQRGELVGTGIRMRGTVYDRRGCSPRSLVIRISARHRFRQHAVNPEISPWLEIRFERWIILRAADSGLVMVRRKAGCSSVLLSVIAIAPSAPTAEGRLAASCTEIVEVEGEVEID